MNKRSVGLVALGFAAGYAICWWYRPIPALASSGGGGSKMQNPAKVLLDTSDSIQRVRPLLLPIAEGKVPSPSNIYNIISGI